MSMPDQPPKPGDPETARGTEAGDDQGAGASERERADRGLTDFVRRALSAGVGAASRSKDDIMRVAAGEVRSWLDHLDINSEVLKVLSKMVIEVKTEIRFRPTEDGKITPEASNDVKIKSGPTGS
jgi:hypothetical protein